MEQAVIIKTVREYVKKTCANEATGHDWWHLQRVYNNAVLINQQEKANLLLITLIAYLHDLYDHKFYQGDVAEKLRETLTELGVAAALSPADLANVIDSCANLGYSRNLISKHKLSKEGQIVQDADRLDAIGAIGIARTFAYGGQKGRLLYDPTAPHLVSPQTYGENGSATTIDHFYDKLLQLKDLMNTATAKKIAAARHQYLVDFLAEFLAEWSGER